MKLMPPGHIPVNPEVIAPSGHALLGPSGAERWLSCTPSARLGESIPDVSSVFAEEGTAAHHAAEARLAWLLSAGTARDKLQYQTRVKQIRRDYAVHIEEWTNADWDAIDEYVDYVLGEAERISKLPGVDPDETLVGLEVLVDFSKFVPMGSGTADAIIWNRDAGVVKVIDLKFGRGVPVDAKGNPQARLYALGAAIGLDLDPDTLIQWAIVQPRVGYVGEDSTTVAELLEWAEAYVQPRAELAWRGEGELVPSESACRFCKVAPTCRARFDMMSELALREFMEPGAPGEETTLKDALALGPDEIGALLPKLDEWISWAQSIKGRALSMARDEGIPIPGHKLVAGRTSRSWAVPESQVAHVLVEDAGIDREEVFEAPKVKSVAQMEKAVGKKKYGEVVLPMVFIKPGSPALVPESDRREALVIHTEESALAEFGEVAE